MDATRYVLFMKVPTRKVLIMKIGVRFSPDSPLQAYGKENIALKRVIRLD